MTSSPAWVPYKDPMHAEASPAVLSKATEPKNKPALDDMPHGPVVADALAGLHVKVVTPREPLQARQTLTLGNPIFAQAQSNKDAGGHTSYTVSVTTEFGGWWVSTRYSEVEAFVDAMRGKGVALPDLPRKHLFFSSSDSSIRERVEAFNTIFGLLVREGRTEEPLVRELLELHRGEAVMQKELFRLEVEARQRAEGKSITEKAAAEAEEKKREARAAAAYAEAIQEQRANEVGRQGAAAGLEEEEEEEEGGDPREGVGGDLLSNKLREECEEACGQACLGGSQTLTLTLSGRCLCLYRG